MNKNEKSIIAHALMLYDVNCEYEIEYSGSMIEIYVNTLPGYYNIISIYGGLSCGRCKIDSEFVLTDNIRSFINHWIRYNNFNKNISHVAIRMGSDSISDIVVISDAKWYAVLTNSVSLSDWMGCDW